MEQIEELDDLKESDSLFILFDKNERGLKYEYIREDYRIRIFDGNIYVFDRGLDLKSIFPIDWVKQFIRVGRDE